MLKGNTTYAVFDISWYDAILHTLEVQYGKHCLNKVIKHEICTYIASQPNYAKVTLRKGDTYDETKGKEMAKKKLLKRYYNALIHCHWIVYNYHNNKLREVNMIFCKQLDLINTKLDDYISALKG
jgi:hypothetical protein